MPRLESLHRAHASRGLAIVGVDAREDARAVRRHAEPLSLTFPLVIDPGGKINALYGVIGLARSFIVGRDGRAVAFGVGPHEWGSAPAHALLGALLAEPVSRVGAR
jgi:peroxiredoxin